MSVLLPNAFAGRGRSRYVEVAGLPAKRGVVESRWQTPPGRLRESNCQAVAEEEGDLAAVRPWPDNAGMLKRLWRLLDRLPHPPGLAIVDRHLSIVDANRAHLDMWGPIIGETCHWAYNRFKRPCPWCPVVLSLDDCSLHVGTAVSPSKEDPGRLVYSVIVAVPDECADGSEPDVVLEIVLVLTADEAGKTRATRDRHMRLAELAAALERVPEESVDVLVLLGAVAKDGLGFRTATLASTVPSPEPSVGLEITRSRSLDASDDLPRLGEIGRELVKATAVARFRCTDRVVPAGCSEFLGSWAAGDLPMQLQSWFARPYPVRLSTSVAATGMVVPSQGIQRILVGEVDPDADLVSDEALADMLFYATLVGQAIDRRALGGLVKNLASLYKRLDEDRPVFIAGALLLVMEAHELDDPMHALDTARSNLDCCETLVPPQVRTEIRHLVDAAKEIKASVRRLTSVAGLARPVLLDEGLHKLLQEQIDTWRPRLRRKRIDPIVSFRADQDGVRVDKRLIGMMFSNLLSNSESWVRGVHRDLKVRIETWNEDGGIVLQYEDNGPGIAPELAREVWKPFVSGRGTDGLGLGLPIVKSIVQDIHHGTVKLDGRYGRGARFTIWLPLV